MDHTKMINLIITINKIKAEDAISHQST